MSWAERNWFVVIEYDKKDKKHSKVLTDNPIFGFKGAMYEKRLFEKKNTDSNKFYRVVNTNY